MERLRDFPKSGSVIGYNEDLFNYLKKSSRINTVTTAKNPRGIAWNELCYWQFSVASGKQEYKIEQLLPFIPDGAERFRYPATPEECYPPSKWYIDVTKDNEHYVQDFLKWKRNEYNGYTDKWKPEAKVRFYYPQEKDSGGYGSIGSDTVYPGYTKITTDQLISIMLNPKEQYGLPAKWCIESKEDNYKALDDFMHRKSYEWIHYTKDWKVFATHNYFHYPPLKEPMHSDEKPQPGYTLITTNQFLKHVLTHTDKQQQINELKPEENGKQESTSRAIKVQRLNLTVRDTGPIRATGIRCPKVQVKIGSGHLPD